MIRVVHEKFPSLNLWVNKYVILKRISRSQLVPILNLERYFEKTQPTIFPLVWCLLMMRVCKYDQVQVEHVSLYILFDHSLKSNRLISRFEMNRDSLIYDL